MKVQINMINVKDGDAFIIGLEKDNGEKALITIDGGYDHFYEDRVGKRLRELLPKYGGRIRLMICTHYDNDHLEGAREIAREFHEVIDEIWMHKIRKPLAEQVNAMKESLANIREGILQENTLKSLKDRQVTAGLKMIEGYPHLIDFMQELIDLGLEDKIVEATRGKKLKGFEEFEVISPTIDYYNQYLDELKGEKYFEDIASNLIKEEQDYVGSLEGFKMLESIEGANPCASLETSSLQNSVTATNMVSIVTMLTANNRKFLFTGDAGIETFEDNELLDDLTHEVFWLDVPHHGSKNNTSKNMLEHFNPEISFVSGKASANRPHKNIVNCLKTKRTKENQHVSNYPDTTWYITIDEQGNIHYEPQ